MSLSLKTLASSAANLANSISRNLFASSAVNLANSNSFSFAIFAASTFANSISRYCPIFASSALTFANSIWLPPPGHSLSRSQLSLIQFSAAALFSLLPTLFSLFLSPFLAYFPAQRNPAILFPHNLSLFPTFVTYP